MNMQAHLACMRGDFSLKAEFGQNLSGVTALFGPSGSGKTTLLRLIAGLEKSPGGYLRIGESVWQDQKTFIPTHRRQIGFIFQDVELFSHLSVRGNLLYGVRRVAAAPRNFAFDDVVSELKISHLLDRAVKNLSGGEKQLISLGRALLSSPDLLLMDEPLAALDLGAKLYIYPLIRHIADKMRIPIIYVSHSLDEVARLADQMILIEGGRILATGEISQMLTRLDLPLAKSPEAEVLIRGRVESHDDRWKLTTIDFGGEKFRTPQISTTLGSEVRLRVPASDVSLSATRRDDSSFLNIFPATVIDVSTDESAVAMVKLDVQGEILLARVTRMSCNILNIQVGSQVFAQVKGAAVLV